VKHALNVHLHIIGTNARNFLLSNKARANLGKPRLLAKQIVNPKWYNFIGFSKKFLTNFHPYGGFKM
jgi:hypothetical protein